MEEKEERMEKGKQDHQTKVMKKKKKKKKKKRKGRGRKSITSWKENHNDTQEVHRTASKVARSIKREMYRKAEQGKWDEMSGNLPPRMVRPTFLSFFFPSSFLLLSFFFPSSFLLLSFFFPSSSFFSFIFFMFDAI